MRVVSSRPVVKESRRERARGGGILPSPSHPHCAAPHMPLPVPQPGQVACCYCSTLLACVQCGASPALLCSARPPPAVPPSPAHHRPRPLSSQARQTLRQAPIEERARTGTWAARTQGGDYLSTRHFFIRLAPQRQEPTHTPPQARTDAPSSSRSSFGFYLRLFDSHLSRMAGLNAAFC